MKHLRALTLAGLGLVAATAATVATTQQAAAQAAAPVVVTTTISPWPVWVLGGGVISLMVRAAVVQNQECRELTTDEAITGRVPLWPLYHRSNDRCHPVRPGCEAYVKPTPVPGTTVTEMVIKPSRRHIPSRCRDVFLQPVGGPVITTRY